MFSAVEFVHINQEVIEWEAMDLSLCHGGFMVEVVSEGIFEEMRGFCFFEKLVKII